MTVEWLLLSGSGRSGTTFLNALLNTHPRIALFTEAGIEKIASAISACLSEGLIISDSRETPKSRPPAREEIGVIAKTIYEVRFDKNDILIVGDKMPNVGRNILSSYENYIGHFKSIYIVRNPIDVVSSSMKRRDATAIGADTWHITSVAAAIVEWALNWEHLAALRNDPRVLAVSYERFETDAASEIAKIAEFLNVAAADFAQDIFDGSPIGAGKAPGVLTAAETGILLDILGPVATMIPDKLEAAFELVPVIYPRVELGARIAIDIQEPTAVLFFKSGFSLIEPWGVWTDGHDATMGFRVDKGIETVSVTIELTPFIGGGGAFALHVRSGTISREFSLDSTTNKASIDFECSPGQDGGVRLDLHMPSIKTPLDEPTFDPRALGIGLFAFTVRAVPFC